MVKVAVSKLSGGKLHIPQSILIALALDPNATVQWHTSDSKINQPYVILTTGRRKP